MSEYTGGDDPLAYWRDRKRHEKQTNKSPPVPIITPVMKLRNFFTKLFRVLKRR